MIAVEKIQCSQQYIKEERNLKLILPFLSLNIKSAIRLSQGKRMNEQAEKNKRAQPKSLPLAGEGGPRGTKLERGRKSIRAARMR